MVITGLGLTGALLRWLSAPLLLHRPAADRPDVRAETFAGAMGQGIALGIFGGFRPLVADFLWLQVQDRWEARDLGGTLGHLRLTTAVDPQPLAFWLNGARIIAYDMTEWRLAGLTRGDAMSESVGKRIEAEQARMALAWLREAERFHPGTPVLQIERANVQLNRLHDVAAAAASYRSAAELTDAPYYAARLHAELLRRLGRKAEAYAWLRKIHPKLPPNDAAAAAGLVLARLRGLEADLAIPPRQRYRAD